MSAIEVPKVVIVRWRDCETLSTWLAVPEVLEFANNDRVIYTAGFVIDDTDDRIVIAASHESVFGKVDMCTIIPKCQVLSVVTMQPPVLTTVDGEKLPLEKTPKRSFGI